MKILKKIIISALILLVIPILIATGAYLFASDTTFIPMMSAVLESATGTRITYNNDATITRTLSPSFHFTNLAIEDDDKSYSAQVSELKLQVSLLSLFSGKLDVPFLILGDTKIKIKQSDPATTPSIPDGPATTLSIPESLPIIPIFHDVQIPRVTIDHDGEDLVSSNHFIELSLSLAPETDKFVALMDIELAGNKVHINAELPQTQKSMETKQLTFVASAKSSGADLTSKGTIDFRSSPPSVQASAGLQVPDLQHVSTGVKDFVVEGSLVGQAAIAGNFKQLAVKEISATWQGPQQSVATVDGAIDNIVANGHINDLLAFAGVDFDITLNLSGQSLATSTGNIKLPDMKPFTGKIVISDSDGTLGIDTFQIRSINDNLYSIDATGHFDDFKNPDTLAMTTHITAKDLHLIGSLFDAQWPKIGPVQLDSEIQPKGKNLEFNTTFVAGELKLQSAISGLFHTNPPQISGKITAKNFFLPSFAGSNAEVTNNAEDTKSEKPHKDKIFSLDPIDFNWLKKTDLDLSLEIDSFNPQKSSAQSGQFRIVLQSGHLKISPARLVYPKGELNFDLELDVREQPKLRLEVYGKNLTPWLELEMESSADQNLDIDVKLTSSGSSEKELAANLQGEIYMNMKNGKIRRSLLDLVILDLAGWTLSQVAPEQYEDVRCGVVDYSIKDGIMDTKVLFIETNPILIGGKGTIDLASETIDYVLLPRKKSDIIMSADPVTIKGPFNDPSVTTMPMKAAIRNYGNLFFGPYLFAGDLAASLLSVFSPAEEKRSPCLEYELKHAQEDHLP